MKKTVFKLVIAVQGKTATSKRSSKTISKFINKIPCSKQFLEKPTQATMYVQKELNEYPLTKLTPSNRQRKLSGMLQQKFKTELRPFNKLMENLNLRLTFLDLEEMTELIKFMINKPQLRQRRESIKKLEANVIYQLERSQGKNLEIHIIQAAQTLINEIKELHKKKAYLVV